MGGGSMSPDIMEENVKKLLCEEYDLMKKEI